MKRRIWQYSVLAAFALSAAFAGPPGGGRGGGGFGGRGPISGPAPVGATGPAPVGAAASLIRTPATGYRNGVAPATSYRAGATTRNSGNRNYDRNRHRAPYALFLAPYATYPYYGYDDTSAFDYGAEPEPPNAPLDPATQSILVGQDQLGQQVQQLGAEVEQLRAERQQQQANGYPAQPASPGPAEQDQSQNTPPVTLVLQSGQQIQVRNYAVMDGVFWDFSKQPTRKIPLSSINLAASAQATAANGGEFPDLGQK